MKAWLGSTSWKADLTFLVAKLSYVDPFNVPVILQKKGSLARDTYTDADDFQTPRYFCSTVCSGNWRPAYWKDATVYEDSAAFTSTVLWRRLSLSGPLLGPLFRKLLLFLRLTTEKYICTYKYLQSTKQTCNMRVTNTYCDILLQFHEECNHTFQYLRSEENKMTHLRLLFPPISKRLQTMFSCAT